MKMYYGIVPHIRGSVLIRGSTNVDGLVEAVATPLVPEMDYEDPQDRAVLEKLLADVIASGVYSFYKWEEADEIWGGDRS